LVKPLKAQRGLCGRNLHLLNLRLYNRVFKGFTISKGFTIRSGVSCARFIL
jgi:hypothetical protein